MNSKGWDGSGAYQGHTPPERDPNEPKPEYVTRRPKRRRKGQLNDGSGRRGMVRTRRRSDQTRSSEAAQALSNPGALGGRYCDLRDLRRRALVVLASPHSGVTGADC